MRERGNLALLWFARVALAVSLLAVALSACAPAATPTPQVITKVETVVQKATVVVEVTAVPVPTSVPVKSIKIGYLASIVHPYFEPVIKGLGDAEKDMGVTVQYLAPSDADITMQIGMFEALVSMGVDAIGICPVDANGVIGVVNEAIAKGIPVITFGNDAPASNRYAFMGTNNYNAGVAVADRIATLLGGSGKIAVALGDPTNPAVLDREKGFKDRLAEKYANISIVSTTSNCDAPDTSIANAEAVISANPQIDGMVGLCQYCSLGQALAVEGVKRAGDVKIVAFDDSQEILDAIGRGTIESTVVQAPYAQGYLGVKALLLLLEGKKPKNALIDTGIVFATKDNLQTYQADVAANAAKLATELPGLFE